MKPKIEFSEQVSEVGRRRVLEVQEAADARKSILVSGPAESKPLRAPGRPNEHPTRTRPAPPDGHRTHAAESAVDWWSRPRD